MSIISGSIGDAALLAAELQAIKTRWDNWATFAVTAGAGSGTWTSVSGQSRWLRVGALVFLTLSLNGTTSSTTNELSIVLPINASNINSNGGGALVRNGGSVRRSGFWRITTADLLRVYPYDNSNFFTAGSERGFECVAVYRVAV